MLRNHLEYIVFGILLFASCNPNSNNQEATQTESLSIEITRQQFESESMQLGSARVMPFSEAIVVNGVVVARPNGAAMVSPPIGGIVQSIRYEVGQCVEKGASLFEISGNEVIDIQHRFSEAASLLRRVQSEYDRIKTLYEEQIGSEKDFIQAESDFNMARAAYSALRLKLEAMSMNVAAIERGEFVKTYMVKTSIKGYISDIGVTSGQFVDPQMVLAKVVDPEQLQLRLAFFEKDLGKIKIGQSLEFKLIQNPEHSFKAVLSALGKTVDADTRTISGYAQIVDDPQNVFVNNAFVEARIITAVDTVLAVPEEAIIRTEDASFVLSLVRDEKEVLHFNRIKVDAGRVNQGFVEVLSDSDLGQIITHGVYNVVVE